MHSRPPSRSPSGLLCLECASVLWPTPPSTCLDVRALLKSFVPASPSHGLLLAWTLVRCRSAAANLLQVWPLFVPPSVGVRQRRHDQSTCCLFIEQCQKSERPGQAPRYISICGHQAPRSQGRAGPEVNTNSSSLRWA
ncbi:hypothetical protein OH76DRAFT_1052969 [Lentinus brumalis]|uniref:Uncharacterized protein n=1 Tax=Lentinus brumalis TaxID=2498619 RepID=A0A371CWK5_9APHY|nr:hypothetical protein OH76DRAFT_1052969 [Polyporus brumalis]